MYTYPVSILHVPIVLDVVLFTSKYHIKFLLSYYFQFFLPTNVISEQNFPEWMMLLQAVVDKPVPAAAMEHEEDDRPRLAWWKVKKWAMKIMCRVFER